MEYQNLDTFLESGREVNLIQVFQEILILSPSRARSLHAKDVMREASCKVMDVTFSERTETISRVPAARENPTAK